MTVPLQILLLALQTNLSSAPAVWKEEALLVRAKKLEDDAWQMIFQQHYPRLYSYLYYQVGNADVAEDLCGLVFERAVKHIHRFNPRKGGLAGWLTRIAQNLARDYHRRNRTRAPEPLELNEAWIAHGKDPSALLLAQESSRYLYQALQQLTEEQRNVILLRFLAQMKLPEVARTLGKSVGAVKSLQHRALATLRKELKKLGYYE